MIEKSQNKNHLFFLNFSYIKVHIPEMTCGPVMTIKGNLPSAGSRVRTGSCFGSGEGGGTDGEEDMATTRCEGINVYFFQELKFDF